MKFVKNRRLYQILRFSLLRLLPRADFKNARPLFKPYVGGGDYSVPFGGADGAYGKKAADGNAPTSSAPQNYADEGNLSRDMVPSPALMSFYRKHENAKNRCGKLKINH